MMSATMDGTVLGNYFQGAPRVSFPGRAFPVKTFYLEDALQLVKHRVTRDADWSRTSRYRYYTDSQKILYAGGSACSSSL